MPSLNFLLKRVVSDVFLILLLSDEIIIERTKNWIWLTSVEIEEGFVDVGDHAEDWPNHAIVRFGLVSHHAYIERATISLTFCSSLI